MALPMAQAASLPPGAFAGGCGLLVGQAGMGAHVAHPGMLMPQLDQAAVLLGIDPTQLRLAQSVGALRLQVIREAAQQQYLAEYSRQVEEAQQLHEKQQEAAQLALIMEAAQAQAEIAKQTLEEDKDEVDWRRKGRNATMCGNWQRGYCKHGDACQYSHPDKEFASASTKRGPADLMRHNFKTAVCRLFSTGTCAHGARCMFAHGPGELRSPGMPLSKDEEEMVQRVAAGGKRNKEAREQATVAATFGFPPATFLPSQSVGAASVGGSGAPSVAQQVATAQMIALAGHAAASMPPLAGGKSSASSST